MFRSKRAAIALAACVGGLLGQAGAAQARQAAPTLPALAFGRPADAKPPTDLAECVPADALVYGSWSGQEAVHQAYLASDFARLWDEPSVAAFRTGMAGLVEARMDLLRKGLGEMEAEERAPVAALAEMWELIKLCYRRPGALTLVYSPDLPKDDDLWDTYGAMPMLIAMVDVGEKADDRQAFAERVYRPMLGAILSTSPGAEVASLEHGGAALHQIRIERDVMVRPTWTVRGNVFIFGLSEQTVRRAVDAAAGKAPRLADLPAYRTVRARWGPGTPLTRSWVNATRIVQVVEAREADADRGTFRRKLTALGLDRACYGGSIRFAGRAVVANRYVLAPGKEGVLFPFVNRPLSEEEQSIVPADALAGVVFRASPRQLYGYAQARMRLAEPPVERNVFDMDTALSAARDLGVTIALSTFGDTGGFVLYQNPSQPLRQRAADILSFAGGGTGKAPVRPADARPPFDDPAEFAQPWQIVLKWKVIDVAKAVGTGATPAAVVGRHLFRCFDAPLTNLPEPAKHQWKDQVVLYMRDGQGGQVAWVYQGDYLVVSNSIAGVVRVLSARPEDAAVRSEPVARYAASRPKDVTMFAYVNTRQFAEAAMGGLAGLTDELGRAGVKVQLKPLPDARAVVGNVSPVVLTASADEEGVLFSEIGSMALSGWPMAALPGLGALMATALAPGGGEGP